MGFGQTLKRIRLNRNMSQEKIAAGLITQGTYSRIERDQLQLDVELFLKLLERLNISSNEFLFIHNNYQAIEHESIMKDFRDLEITLPETLNNHMRRLSIYLKRYPSSNLNKVFIAYQILYLYVVEGNIELAKQKASLVWSDFQKLDSWYIDDLILLNSLLILFPLDTAIEITTTALKRIDAYEHFEKDLTYLKIYFEMDLCVILIQQQKYELVLHKLNYIYENYKQKMSYQTLVALFTNRAICLFHLNKPVEEELTKLNLLLSLYGESSLLDSLLKIFKNHTIEMNK
ncbi:helix-turn-helix domain-containing protein [Psychrobacillus sp. NPDC096426]|uniref:helix-turn-helix domain-containing protein n=1 Tax=Psychrobacillus sp. NPDC096426 TaxID=3364491 RepID=UPI0038075A3C